MFLESEAAITTSTSYFFVVPSVAVTVNSTGPLEKSTVDASAGFIVFPEIVMSGTRASMSVLKGTTRFAVVSPTIPVTLEGVGYVMDQQPAHGAYLTADPVQLTFKWSW